MKTLLISIAIALGSIAGAQEKPELLDKKDLPKTAVATFCGPDGKTEMERPNVGYRYKGKIYYFCDKPAINAFLKDPEAFLPPILPRDMPEFSLPDTTGKTWDAESMKGKVVLIDFWATWCAPCKKMMPTLDKVYAKYKEKGLELLSVSTDQKKSDLDKFLGGHLFPNPVVHDTKETFKKWGVKFIPATFLVRDGKIVAHWTGIATEKELSAAIEANIIPN